MGNNPNHLDPSLREKYEKLREWSIQNGTPIELTSTWRSPEEQAKLYENYKAGRSKYPAAAPGKSAHNCTDENGNPSAQAFDIKFQGGGDIRTVDKNNNGIPDIQEVAKKADELGVKWYGNKDPVHFYSPNWRGNCLAKSKQEYKPTQEEKPAPQPKPEKPKPEEPPPPPKPKPTPQKPVPPPPAPPRPPRPERIPQPMPFPNDECGRGKTRYNDIAILCSIGRLIITFSPDHITDGRKDIRIRDLGRHSCPDGCTIFFVLTSSRKKIINARGATRRKDLVYCPCGHIGRVFTSSRDSFLK